MNKNIFMAGLMMIIIAVATGNASAQEKKHHRGMHRQHTEVATDAESAAMNDSANVKFHRGGHHRNMKFGCGCQCCQPQKMHKGRRVYMGKRGHQAFEVETVKLTEGQILDMLPRGARADVKDGKQVFFSRGAKLEMIVEKGDVKYKVVEVREPKKVTKPRPGVAEPTA